MSIRHSLLALLSVKPHYGQQLKAEFEVRTGEVWPLNVGQVYTTLDRLERDGLVEATAADAATPLRPYRITDAGRAELAGWFRADRSPEPPPRNELIMKVMIAASIDPGGAAVVIQSHRRQLIESMRHFTRLKAAPGAGTAALVMCDAELFRLEAMVRWLDSVEGRLRAGARLAPDRPAPADTTAAPGPPDGPDQPAPAVPVAPGRRSKRARS